MYVIHICITRIKYEEKEILIFNVIVLKKFYKNIKTFKKNNVCFIRIFSIFSFQKRK